MGLALTACEREEPAPPQKENMSIAVDTDGKITLNGKLVTQEELEPHLCSHSKARSVIIEQDATGQYTKTTEQMGPTCEFTEKTIIEVEPGGKYSVTAN